MVLSACPVARGLFVLKARSQLVLDQENRAVLERDENVGFSLGLAAEVLVNGMPDLLDRLRGDPDPVHERFRKADVEGQLFHEETIKVSLIVGNPGDQRVQSGLHRLSLRAPSGLPYEVKIA